MHYHILCQCELCLSTSADSFLSVLLPLLKMKTCVFIVFLALPYCMILVLCHQDVHKPGAKRSLGSCEKTNKALDNLLGNNRPIHGKLKVTPDGCEEVMYEHKSPLKSGDKTIGVRFDPEKFCYVEGDSNLVVTVKSKDETPAPGGEGCATLPAFQAAFLVQDKNANTYMILNPFRSHWFFTRPLGGCDMFVATNPRNRDGPIVIHSNLDSCGSKKKNLEEKGNSVDEMMRYHPRYTLIARVYGHGAPPPSTDRRDADLYFREYRASHPGIRIISYDNYLPATPQPFQFIGQYKEGESWKFTLKGEIDGIIFGHISI